MTETAAAAPRAFLSYSRRNGEMATRIFEALQAAGVDVFRDTEDILPAEDWRDRLRGLITSADAIVYLMSPASVASEVCGWEVEITGTQNKRIVPVVLAPVAEADTPPEIARLNYVFATPDDDFDAAIAAITAAISTDIGWVRNHTRFGERALEWANGGALLRGAALTEAETWLARQPEGAPAPTATTRDWITASRSAATRRQRLWVAGSLSVAIVSIGLGIVAEVNRRIAAEQRDRAERILDRSSQTANDLVFDMAQRFRDRSGVPQDLVQDLLGRSKGLLDQLSEAGEARADLARSRAAALTEMSITLARQGDLAGASTVAAEATAIFRALAGAEGGPDAQADLAVGLDREGDIWMRRGETDEAEARYREAHDLNSALVARDDRTSTWQVNLAVSEEKLGDIAALQGDQAAALGHFETASSIRDQAGPADRGTAILLEKRGDALFAAGDSAAALTVYRQSLVLTEQLATQTPDDTRLVRDQSVIHQKLGDLLLDREGAEAARPHFAADLAIARRLHLADRAREDWALDLGVSLDRQGLLQFQLGEGTAATDTMAEAFSLLTALAAAQPGRADLQRLATKAAQKVSLISFALGDYHKAAKAAQQDAARMAAAGTTIAAEQADAINNVAWYSLFTAAPDDALSAARQATAMMPDNTGYRLNLAHALLLTGDFEAALAIYRAGDTEDWQAMIDADFSAFAEAGIAQDLIGKARHALFD